MVAGLYGGNFHPVQLNVAMAPECWNASVQIQHQKMEDTFVQDPALK